MPPHTRATGALPLGTEGAAEEETGPGLPLARSLSLTAHPMASGIKTQTKKALEVYTRMGWTRVCCAIPAAKVSESV